MVFQKWPLQVGAALATGVIDGGDIADFAGDVGDALAGAAEDVGEAVRCPFCSLFGQFRNWKLSPALFSGSSPYSPSIYPYIYPPTPTLRNL